MSDFDPKISLAEKEAKGLFELLETYRPKFLDAILEHTKPWIADRVQRGAIKDFPTKTKEMGKSAITEIKAEIKRAIDESTEEVKILLDNKKFWPHLGEMPKNIEPVVGLEPYYEKIKIFEESIATVIRSQFGKAGRILKKYGIIEFSQYGEWADGGKDVFYSSSYRVDLSEPIKLLIKTYGELCRKLIQNATSINALKFQKEQHEAREAWEKS